MRTAQHPPTALPATIDCVEQLDDALSQPSDQLIAAMTRISGPIIILGVGGKMGPTLARMICRADAAAGIERKVYGVSRFSTGNLASQLTEWGVQAITADLLDPAQLDRLPDAPNVIYMAGFKFGASENAAKTWAMNVLLPGMVCRKYPTSRIAAFSSGNIYPMTTINGGGSTEADAVGPIGEYAITCLGRERAFEHYSRSAKTPVSLIRLSYACELRYGVLVDIAQCVWNNQPVNITNNCFKVIWQADANEMSIRALEYADSPPFILNVTGPEVMSMRRVAEQFGQLMDRTPVFEGVEADCMRLNNAQFSHRLFGYPRVGVEQMIHWVSDWIKRGGESLNKPTHFEVRNGKY